MPAKRPSVKNEKQYEALKYKGMSKERVMSPAFSGQWFVEARYAADVSATYALCASAGVR